MIVTQLELDNDYGSVELIQETTMKLRVDGYVVPYVEVAYQNAFGVDPMAHIILDHRMTYEIPVELLPTVSRLVADAMAIAAGRTSFGDNSLPKNLYGNNGAQINPQGIAYQDEGFEE